MIRATIVPVRNVTLNICIDQPTVKGRPTYQPF